MLWGFSDVFPAICAAAATVALAGCDYDEPKHRHGPMPEAVTVAAADVDVGVHRGVMHDNVHVDAFRIARYPVSVADYQACVEKRACSLDADETAACAEWTDSALVNTPATCITVAQANSYCGWVGGHLASVGQWMLAARGPAITRFPWGSQPPACHQSWAGLCKDKVETCANGEKDCGPKASHEVGKHPKGASPSGVEDLLLLDGGELMSGGVGDIYGCGTSTGCTVRSAPNTPGSIDFVGALGQRTAPTGFWR